MIKLSPFVWIKYENSLSQYHFFQFSKSLRKANVFNTTDTIAQLYKTYYSSRFSFFLFIRLLNPYYFTKTIETILVYPIKKNMSSFFQQKTHFQSCQLTEC